VIGHDSFSDWSFSDRSGSDSSSSDTDPEPFAPKVGPFPRRGFLQAWWEEFQPDAKLVILASERGVLPLMETSGLI